MFCRTRCLSNPFSIDRTTMSLFNLEGQTFVAMAKRVSLWHTRQAFLADRTATQYDRLLGAACCPSVRLSVCLSVTLCILTLRVGVRG